MGPRTDGALSWAAKGLLGVEIALAYLRVRRELGRASLPAVVAALRRAPAVAPALPLSAGPQDGPRLARAVVRTTRRLPAGSRCLTRSLVLLNLLARRGVDSTLVIAVQPSEAVALDAHAWVEVEQRPLLATAASFGRLVSL